MSISGFALRNNGSCADNEVDCGQTAAPYHACCPKSAFCPRQYNVDCCPSAENCTTTLLRDPQCANRSWDLYDNGGYFCCERGFVGYATPGNSDGCAAPGYAFRSGEKLLPIISSATPSSTTSPISTTPSSSPSASATTPADSSGGGGGSDKGAIIGGVVGGVVGVLVLVALSIFFWRRQKRSRGNPQDSTAYKGGIGGVPELAGSDLTPEQRSAHEMDGYDGRGKVAGPAQLPERHEYNELQA
ncbi:hypothetical protein QBC33DRAFT_67052 [Phialemonium atrogriseum]|uniref:Mid2 domain-containing protein n=1 Tax=Phialemonium atrogriseum TaxID=1093897 RepID=A0AAJ0BZK3_9PEZI|nr:uncharacterized protein QBC33DRAFT_67052 [Phialemonium atrogriseum]KAK1767379.1 hypothetical protein QBC33DRAFT_67052 [Phialemonium atrogriseum]